MSRVSFSVSPSERKIIAKIAARAVRMAKKDDVPYEQLGAVMDITACHANGNPLRLQELLDADDVNFAHDVYGIRRFMDRTNGKLLNHFSPRYSAITYRDVDDANGGTGE